MILGSETLPDELTRFSENLSAPLFVEDRVSKASKILAATHT
jgi:hypothetical protein